MQRNILKSYLPGNGVKGLLGIKNIIAVASGKGGVGKSTITANLATYLGTQGYNIGLLDADIYGPSIPKMLGCSQKPKILPGKKIEPLEAHGIKFMSIGNLLAENAPAIWRGPMVSGALMQLLQQTSWGELDILFLDLPPGTGDIQLTMSQKIPVTGGIIVTTPQDIALLDAIKAVEMFKKVNVSVLGAVENMSTHICNNCGQVEAIFGDSGIQALTQMGIPILGNLPLSKNTRIQADNGKPAVLVDIEVQNAFGKICDSLLFNLSQCPRNYAVPVGKVTTE